MQTAPMLPITHVPKKIRKRKCALKGLPVAWSKDARSMAGLVGPLALMAGCHCLGWYGGRPGGWRVVSCSCSKQCIGMGPATSSKRPVGEKGRGEGLTDERGWGMRRRSRGEEGRRGCNKPNHL